MSPELPRVNSRQLIRALKRAALRSDVSGEVICTFVEHPMENELLCRSTKVGRSPLAHCELFYETQTSALRSFADF